MGYKRRLIEGIKDEMMRRKFEKMMNEWVRRGGGRENAAFNIAI